MFIKPMLASPLRPGIDINPELWVAEEKYDGHRIITEISDTANTLFTEKGVTAWSRYEIARQLPTHILEPLGKFPNVLLDGELLAPGKRSYGVTELKNSADLVYFVFDILQYEGEDAMPAPHAARRKLLEMLPFGGAVQLAPATPLKSWDHILELRDEVWARDGEGLILKRRNAPYVPGKRSKDFIKIKKLQSIVLTVIGFAPSRGEINDRGPYAKTIVREDETGYITSVKTRNDALCRELEKLATGDPTTHPYIGRKLRIEYQERTPDMSFRHGRWDRWEDE